MSRIRFEEVTKDNLWPISKLSDTLTPNQKKCVASNAYSVAQAHYYPDNAWFRGVYLGDEPIGFVMVDVQMDDIPEEDTPSIMLWRFMISRDHQNKGYGKEALDLIVEQFKDQGYKYFYTSCTLTEEGPFDFYVKYGFVDTGIMEDDEELLKMAFPT